MVYDENGEAYMIDGCGQRVYAGDYVECIVHNYSSIRFGERRRVQDIQNDNYVLNNGKSLHGTSQYRPYNFKLAGRHHSYHKAQEKAMSKPVLYVALRTRGRSYETIADDINKSSMHSSGNGIHADTSYDSLQGWLRQRICVYPDEVWLILSGTTLAEISSPPVVFRTA
jgi:hypothetical protein